MGRRNHRNEVHSNSFFEPVYYELKPILLIVLGFTGLTHAPVDNFLVKLNILTLFVLGAYMIYSRAQYRGYFK